MKIINIQPHTEAWHAWRSLGITATDACVLAANIGFTPYDKYDVKPFKTEYQLWAEKVLKVESVDISCNPYVRRGVRYEDTARRMLEKKFKTILLPVCVEGEDPILRASLDGIYGNQPVEIKVPSDKNFDLIVKYGKNCGTFWSYYPQLQHQMLVTDAKVGWLAFYSPTTRQMKLFQVDRDSAFIERIQLAYRNFSKLMLSKNKQPKLDSLRDSFQPPLDIKDEWTALEKQCESVGNEVKELEAKLAELKSKQTNIQSNMVDLMRANGNFYVYRGKNISIKRFFKKGKIDYARFVEDQELACENSIDSYRKPAEENVRVTVH